MKSMKGVFWGLVLAAALVVSQVVFASNHMTDSQKSALESVGVLVYPGAIFLSSDEDGHMVLWFSSPDSPDTIMAWYEENLPDWSAATISGTRVVYKGPAGLDQERIMAVPYVFVSSAERLGKDPSDDNEITIRIPASP